MKEYFKKNYQKNKKRSIKNGKGIVQAGEKPGWHKRYG